MKKGIIAAVVVAIVIVGGVFAFMLSSNSKNDTAKSTTSSQTQNNAATPSNNSGNNSTQPTAETSTITYKDGAFSPNTITVKSGTEVTVKNESSVDMQFDSDPHPTHTDDPELNGGTVAPGSSRTFTVEKTGTFGYHNHLDPTQTGTIIIQ